MSQKATNQRQIDELVFLFQERNFGEVVAKARPLLKKNKKSFVLNKIVGAAEAELGRYDVALICFKRLRQINPKSAEPYLLIGNVMVAEQRKHDAINYFELALKKQPDLFAAAYNLGCQLLEVQRTGDAIIPLRTAISLEPKSVSANLNLGIALFRSGELQEAETVLSKTTAANPQLFEANLNLGLIKLEMGKYNAAIELLEEAEKIRPSMPQTAYALGVSHRGLGNYIQATKFLYAAISYQQGFKEAVWQLASLELELGHFEKAQSLYAELLLAEPESVPLKLQLVEAYRQSKSYSPAIEILEGILNKDTKSLLAKRALAQIYFEDRRDTKALKYYDEILQENPNEAEILYNSALIFSRNGRNQDAVIALEAAIRSKPDLDAAIAALVYQKKLNCDWDLAELNENKISKLGIQGDVISPFNALAFEDNPMHQQIRSTNYSKFHFSRYQKDKRAFNIGKSDRIRIGYFSGDIYDHPLLDLFQGVLREHDKTRFDVRMFSCGPIKTGLARELAKKSVNKFNDASSWSNSKFLSHLEEDPIDIAVDLSGYTEFSRTDILASRVAPVQISHLGYPSTTGANFIDYLVADKTLIPTEYRDFFSENIIYMPNSFQSNDNQRKTRSPQTTRSQNKLPEEGMVFCCFHNSYKICEAVFKIWLRILEKVPKSVLWFSNLSSVAIHNLEKIAKESNIDPERLIFAPKLQKDQHLERLRHADLFLDTFNVNAGANASDALWSNVPVLTKIGKQFSARMAASLNRAVELDVFVTETEDEYEALAVKLASDTELLKKWKNHLSENKMHLPLFDTVSYTRSFEAGLLKAHELAISGESPKDIYL